MRGGVLPATSSSLPRTLLLQSTSSEARQTLALTPPTTTAVEEKEKEKRKRAVEGKTFSFVSVLLSSGREMIKLAVRIVTTGKAEVSFVYVCICVGKRE